MKLLASHDWPGNVRELQNAVERAVVVGTPPILAAEDLPLRPRSSAPPPGATLTDVERHHIASVLDQTSWNITRAAEILDVDRVTVYNKIKKYGLSRNGLPLTAEPET